MIEISKELLQQLVKNLTVKEVITTKNNKIDNNIYYSIEEIDILQANNIYELCHMMKEWIINKGYVLRICYVLENDTRELAFVETTLYKSNQYLSDYYDMDNKTEIEAVIKACEWILINDKK